MNRRIIPSLLTLASLFALPLAVRGAPTKWNVDKEHVSVGFEINHFFTPVKGQFLDFGGTFNLDKEDLTKSPSIEFTVNVASVSTANKKRAGHLQSADFFNAKSWAEIKFTSTNVVKTGDQTFKAVGTLQIRDVKRPFEVPFTLLGVQKVKMGLMNTEVMGIRAKTELNRNDFGVGTDSWAATAVVGGTVGIDILLELK
ncbi:MAG: polyisoprenoid-binding protein [Verrucomicrobia bacterium]|nr:polyisoprenoid-binding protein [Verrucomicrobiota bacterium]